MRFGIVPTSWGEFLVGWGEGGISSLHFPGRWPRVAVGDGGRILEWLREELEAYFQGRLREFDLPLSPEGTPFQLEVWGLLRGIPYGATVTYGELAARIGRPRAARAVGRAVAANPIPILIPCHRVVPSSGGIGNYGPGRGWKERLLRLEGAV